ncbi:lysozyme C, milk isozyme-like isoform X3 [Podarcis raffonei]|uniref:lysozyme C, milk isozyme-like isoform X3 n=1 Tax=Podarcis raffonei TaxID=65483 RepID=UPI0023297CEF|nr:lysozyme C, milk isozyme-like isoform X3 [Podarcis raffonei]
MVANETRKFEDCELFYKLRDLGLDGFRGIDVKQYVCMAGFPANYNTEYYETEEGVPHYGLFHLSGQEWCFNERRPSQNKCNISCDYLLDDDIADDVRCLKKVITEKGLIVCRPLPPMSSMILRTYLVESRLGCLLLGRDSCS